MYSKDKVHEIKILYKKNYKIIIIKRFLLYQNIIFKYSWSMFY